MGTCYIGLDVHKISISVSVAEEGRSGEIRFLGEIPNAPTSIARLAKQLSKNGSRLEFCYEAGCCGYSHNTVRLSTSLFGKATEF